jgi:hypothetical protein
LINVVEYLSSSLLDTIYRGLSATHRLELYPLLSEEILSTLPTIGEFEVSQLEINPIMVEPGEIITVSFMFSNIGEETDDYSLPIKLNGVTEDVYVGILENGKQESFVFDIIVYDPGIYILEIGSFSGSFNVIEPEPGPTPANIQVTTIEIIPTEVRKDGDLVVFISVDNVGEETGQENFILQIDDVYVDSREILLSGGESTTVIFDLKANYDIGSHEVTINNVNQNFVVLEPPPGLPWVTIVTIVVVLIGAIAYILYSREIIDLPFLNF